MTINLKYFSIIIALLTTSCSFTNVYERYGIEAVLYDNHNAIKNKEVIVELNNEQIVTKTNHQGKINLSSKSDTQFYHMGSPLIYDLPNQKIRILVPGYNPVKFEFFKYLPEKSTRIKGEYISENNGIINLGKLELNKEIN